MGPDRWTVAARIALAVYVPVTLWLLLAPRVPGTGAPGGASVGHVVLFAGLAVLLFHALCPLGRMRRVRLTLFCCVAYAAMTEALQLFIPGRHFQVADIAFDIVGASLGIGVALASHRLAAVQRR